MKSFTVTTHNHKIEMKMSRWSGKEEIYCDGRLVSSKRSFHYVSPHSFSLQEGSETVVYEVNLLTGMSGYGYIVRRNGIIVAHEP